MKAKTKMQHEVVALSAGLPPLSAAQGRWARENIMRRKAYVCKNEAWCLCCGGVFKTEEPELGIAIGVNTRIKCPHCGRSLKAEVSRRKKSTESWYYTIVTTCGGYQLCRNFSVSRWIDKGGEPRVEIREAVQNWIDEDGHEEIIARPVRPLTGCYDAWNFCKPMELRCRRGSISAYNMPDKYIVHGAWIYPKRRLLEKVRRNGYSGRNAFVPESEHIKLLLTDREAEALEKNGQYSLFGLKYQRGYEEFRMPFAHAIRVANRNRYKVKDASMWMDYLEALEYFNLDTHNAHYVCPANLKAAHDRLARRRELAEAKRYREEQIMKAAQWESDYKAAKGKYFGICFGDGDITVSVIRSVADMAEEGKAMHHCVFSAKYFKKPESLILSARTKDGSRIETIEVNLKTFEVVQSRAKCNGQSPMHDRIVSLVNQNMNRIREIS